MKQCVRWWNIRWNTKYQVVKLTRWNSKVHSQHSHQHLTHSFSNHFIPGQFHTHTALTFHLSTQSTFTPQTYITTHTPGREASIVFQRQLLLFYLPCWWCSTLKYRIQTFCTSFSFRFLVIKFLCNVYLHVSHSWHMALMANTVLQASPKVRAMLHKVDTISPPLKPLPPSKSPPPPSLSLSLILISPLSLSKVSFRFVQLEISSDVDSQKPCLLSLSNLVTKLPLWLPENSRSQDRAECRRL